MSLEHKISVLQYYADSVEGLLCQPACPLPPCPGGLFLVHSSDGCLLIVTLAPHCLTHIFHATPISSTPLKKLLRSFVREFVLRRNIYLFFLHGSDGLLVVGTHRLPSCTVLLNSGFK